MKFVAIALVQSLLFSSLTFSMQSSSPPPAWVVQGQDLLVQLKTGKSIKGKLQSATGANLEILAKESRISIEITDVLRIYRLKGHHFAKGALIGAAVGAGSGAIIGTVAYKKGNDWGDFGRGFNATAGSVTGVLIGILTGLTIGAFWHKKELVYEAPSTR
jgi:hypothetical protein